MIALQADGSALYTPQALWSQAREGAHVVTLICSNRRYRILQMEMELQKVTQNMRDGESWILGQKQSGTVN